MQIAIVVVWVIFIVIILIANEDLTNLQQRDHYLDRNRTWNGPPLPATTIPPIFPPGGEGGGTILNGFTQ